MPQTSDASSLDERNPTVPEISDAEWMIIKHGERYGRADWWQEQFPGFSKQACEILELHVWSEMGEKEIKRYIRKKYGDNRPRKKK